MLGVTPRNVRNARNVLSAVIVALTLVGSTACGDDEATGPANIEGTYNLSTAGGFNVPATFSNGLATVEIKSGTLLLEDGRFDAAVSIELNDSPAILTTDGTYDRNGDRIAFEGKDQDDVDVSLVGIIDGNTITLTDPETGLQLVFEKN